MNNAPHTTHTDIAIVGAGPVGALVALALTRARRRVVLIEARHATSPIVDARSLALSWASQMYLAENGAWPDDSPSTFIDTVHISQQGPWGRVLMTAEDVGLAHLGVVVDYAALTKHLAVQLLASGVEVWWGWQVTQLHTLSQYALITAQNTEQRRQLTARLTVLAEGGALAQDCLRFKQTRYDDPYTALIAQITTQYDHASRAYERFSRQGPVALLPYRDGFKLVWTCQQQQAAALLETDSAEFLQTLEQLFGQRQGRFLTLAGRVTYPLRLRYSHAVVGTRTVLIGNAAQIVHPIAAQGLNLGLRDAKTLLSLLSEAADPGDLTLLNHYAARRRLDRRVVFHFTYALSRLFAKPAGLALPFYAGTMNLLDLLPAARKRLAQQLVFGKRPTRAAAL